MAKNNPLQNISRKLHALYNHHALLETKISREHSRPIPDTLTIQRYKRLKLRLKDKIALMNQHHRNVTQKGQSVCKNQFATWPQ
jgi:hypothetical protein